LRHIGSALRKKAEVSDVSGVSKKTSPAATGKTRPHSRRGIVAARASASRWLAWLAINTNGSFPGRFSAPSTRIRWYRLK
jgi:hypothetical protein